eukprot:TRINITY_DN333_c0_g1_i1.p1 TRINITY_DN333_c0_g1~~TRINITY_DN333_c0_g1_i1.p1  ORF type:complete len:562 (-),score=106.66 TRINITY_DN333_c0_g1_i1:31-1716(-)
METTVDVLKTTGLLVGGFVGIQLLRVGKILLLDAIQTKDPKEPLPKDLPNQVLLKTKTETFNHQYYIAVRYGRIYYKKIETQDQVDKQQWNTWILLGVDGLPHPGKFFNFVPSGWFAFDFKKPKSIVEIDADGDNLICIGDNRIVYYLKLDQFKWQGRWGMYLYLGFKLGPAAWIKLPEDNLGYAISHRGSYNAYMEDINGTKHHSTTGCTTLYLLDPNQLDIVYNDPWLSPYWNEHTFEGPTESALDSYKENHKPVDGLYPTDRHRIKMLHLTASGSNMFVVSTNGLLFTRLVDFDIAGLNPVFKYTYERKTFPTDTVRGLPAPGWVQHTSITPDQGSITKMLTIFQCGQGSAAYTLRVAGFNNKGEKGYFTKPIIPANGPWTFVPDLDLPISQSETINVNTALQLGPVVGADYTCTQKIANKSVTITLKDYHPSYSETDVIITVDSEVLNYSIKLYAIGLDKKFKGTIVIPERFVEDNPHNLMAPLFGSRQLIPVKISPPKKFMFGLFSKGTEEYPTFVIADRLDKDSVGPIRALPKYFVTKRIKWNFQKQKKTVEGHN